MYTRVSETIFCLLHFIWFKHIEPCDVTSLVLRSVKKIQKISKPALFWKVQVDQEKQKKPHVKIDISIKLRYNRIKWWPKRMLNLSCFKILWTSLCQWYSYVALVFPIIMLFCVMEVLLFSWAHSLTDVWYQFITLQCNSITTKMIFNDAFIFDKNRA